jgi:1-acyl-sn-glycerol-3-phosphate acyltransferase
MNSGLWTFLEPGRIESALRSLARVLKFYFRVEVKGRELIPHDQPVLFVANHSGFAGTDALLLMQILADEGFGTVQVMAHWAYFRLSTWLRTFADRFGLKEASVKNAVMSLKGGYSVLVFPEGEAGNFKATSKRYRLQRFHSGAVRIALQGGAAVIPVIVIGAEESHINLKDIDLTDKVKNLHIPIPLNLIPLPAKWTIVFDKPFDIHTFKNKDMTETDWTTLATHKLRRHMQKMINEELKSRPYIFSPGVDRLLSRSRWISKFMLKK